MFPSKLEIDALNQDFLKKVISEEERKEKRKSLYRWVRLECQLAYLNGVFPITNTFTAEKAASLSFKKLSWAYFYSWLMFAFKGFAIMIIGELMNQFNASKNYKETAVDKFAGGVSFTLVFGFGIFAQMLSSLGLPGLLDTIKSVEDYDEKYLHPSKKTGCFYAKIFVNACLGLLIAITPMMIGFSMYWTGKPPLVMSFWFGHYTHDRILISALVSSMSFTMEFGVMFLFGKIFGLCASMTDRLVGITRAVETKSETKSWTLGSSDKSWLDLSYQYLAYHGVFEKVEKSLAFYFIVMFPALIVAAVCTIYFKINSESPLAKEAGILLPIGIGICFYRIYALADCGEILERKYRNLVKTLLRINQDSQFLIDEKKQFKQFLKLVKTIPVTLSAGGYFTVNRNNVTSISGVILTYIIVLLQFNMSNPAAFDGHLNRTDVGINNTQQEL